MNDKSATKPKQRRRRRSRSTTRDDRKSNDDKRTGPNQRTPKQKKAIDKDTTYPELDGVLLSIKTLIESHRPRLANVMADHSIAMLRTIREIRERSISIKKFSRPDADNNAATDMAVDDADERAGPIQRAQAAAGDIDAPALVDDDPDASVPQTHGTQTFVPVSLRSKMPLKPSKKIINDSRVGDEYARVLTTLEAATKLHDDYLVKLSKLAEQIARAELDARISILEHEFLDAIGMITRGLLFVKIHMDELYPESYDEDDLANIAAFAVLDALPNEYFANLQFVTTDKKTWVDEKTKKALTAGQKNIASILVNDGNRPAAILVRATRDAVLAVIPTLTTALWTLDVTNAKEKALDAKLRAVTTIKAIDKANTKLNDALDNDAGELLDPIVKKHVKSYVNEKLSREKKSRRKNSSAGGKTQPSQPEHGRKNYANSKRSGKRLKDTSSTDSSGRSGTRRGRSRPRRSDNSEQRTPPSILRLRTEKWDPRRKDRGQSSEEESFDNDDDWTISSEEDRPRIRNASKGARHRDSRRPSGHRDGATYAGRRGRQSRN